MFNDGIPRHHCFSLTDFNDFEYCPFKFFVSHHLEKKYELAEGSENLALGVLLDDAIKLFYASKSYGCPVEYLSHLVKASCRRLLSKIDSQTKPSFYSAIKPFLNEELCSKASGIIKKFYTDLENKLPVSLGELDFCSYLLIDGDKTYKIWGVPDTLEMGKDGTPEIVDYKFRENLEKGKANMDMDIMPKIYTLLCLSKLKSLGYKTARFRVKFWQDAKEDSFYEEFNLGEVAFFEEIFKLKIRRILSISNLVFCEKNFCRACNNPDREKFIKILEEKFNLLVGFDLAT